MNSDLALFERQAKQLAPQFDEVLSAANVPTDRFLRTLLVSVERNPRLLQCNRQSLLNSAMSAAVLGLEPDGVTGQSYLVPFGGKAQLIIGYKGYNTMAARSGYTITGGVVREGDQFEFQEGTDGYVRNKRKLGHEHDRQIIAAWANAEAPGRSPMVAVLSIDELMAVKDRAPGSNKKDSPWNDPMVGFAAMCEKTAKRRLARSMPLNVMTLAATMEDAQELGQSAYVSPEKGVVIEGKIESKESQQPTAETVTTAPTFSVILATGEERTFASPEQWMEFMLRGLDALRMDQGRLREFWERNEAQAKAVEKVSADCYLMVRDRFEEYNQHQ